jgi:hypothetical protein
MSIDDYQPEQNLLVSQNYVCVLSKYASLGFQAANPL